MNERPLALITGASRKVGLGAAIAVSLAQDGWDVATTYWRPYDHSESSGCSSDDVPWLERHLESAGARTCLIEADLRESNTPDFLFDSIEQSIGPVTALILSHCHGSSSSIRDTTIESFDDHFAVNTRASWLLIKEFGLRYRSEFGRGRIVALTSDHVVGNLPYGASKGALDRIVIAAAHDFRDLGITANVVNPGPINTGWMSDELVEEFKKRTPLGRSAIPTDCANVVRFLCSEEGQWINGQLITANGGFE